VVESDSHGEATSFELSSETLSQSWQNDRPLKPGWSATVCFEKSLARFGPLAAQALVGSQEPRKRGAKTANPMISNAGNPSIIQSINPFPLFPFGVLRIVVYTSDGVANACTTISGTFF
jgi:hypothetical protein